MRFNDEPIEYIPPSIRAAGKRNGSGTGAGTGKTALVLAGGGITGAVYEIGALRAMNDMLINHTVNDFDIYVGTSAGAQRAQQTAPLQNPADNRNFDPYARVRHAFIDSSALRRAFGWLAAGPARVASPTPGGIGFYRLLLFRLQCARHACAIG